MSDNKLKTICVIGLGYIGLPTAVVLASRGILIIGVDVNKDVVKKINRGEIHIVEPDLDALTARAVQNGLLRAASTPAPADAFVIAVPTPFHDGKADLTFKVIVDLMPDFTTTDVSKLTVERLTADIADADINEALDRLAKNARSYVAKDGAAATDDVAVIDYEGSIDGVPFAGGKGEDFSLTLGSSTFIPGFEDGLIGAKAARTRSFD